ncbi:MAG: fibrobacter succinogenes major paralogous domain-containing protein, partial [Fibrobacter sp.]|nr:fibrobacter succinogenes major paralogous domain-containing protein [Fibrobacter sp.]
TTRYNVGSRYNYWADNVLRIRNNIVDWKIGSVPKFGKYILKIKCGISDWIINCYEVCDVEGAIINKSDDFWNICLDGVWFNAGANAVDTYGWDTGVDGELRKSDLTDRYYKYDEVLNDWVGLDVYGTDRDLGLNGCTSKREGEIGLSPKDDIYYVCKHFVDIADGYDERKWVKAQEIDFIKRDEKCESEDVGRIIPGIDTVTNNYYCSRIGWVDLRTWSFGVPKEFHFNSDVNYGSLTDGRDGKTYKTVKIGDQVWMAENLNYAVDGIGHCYEDVPENCEVAGRLYKWDVAREVCPEGWHLPSKAEFDTLLSFVKREYEEEQCSLADMLKATSGWNYGYQGCDKVGFSAVPAGGKYIEIYRAPDYIYAGYAALFLTSTEYDEHSVYIMQLNLEMYTGGSFMHYVHGVSLVYDYESTCLEDWPHASTKYSEFSVRCLKDAE